MRLSRLFLAALVCAALFVALQPRPAHAQDGCGLLGMIIGCNYDQQAREAERQAAQQQAELAARQQAQQLAAQQQAQQLQYQQWLASEQAQTELQRIAANERISIAQIQAQLEQMRVQERSNALSATTSFNVAALQSDAMIAVARARAAEAQAGQVMVAMVALCVILCVAATAAATAYAAWQYRRAEEVRAAPLLLPDDDWQRRAVALLDQRGIAWQLRDRRLLAQIDGHWVRVEE